EHSCEERSDDGLTGEVVRDQGGGGERDRGGRDHTRRDGNASEAGGLRVGGHAGRVDARHQTVAHPKRSPRSMPSLRHSPAASSSTDLALRAPAKRHGFRSCATETTVMFLSRNTASIGKRTNIVWTENVGRRSKPSPRRMLFQPMIPRRRVSGLSARWHTWQ